MNKLTSKIIPNVSVLYKLGSTKGTLREERRDYGHDVCINRIRKEGSNRTSSLELLLDKCPGGGGGGFRWNQHTLKDAHTLHGH